MSIKNYFSAASLCSVFSGLARPFIFSAAGLLLMLVTASGCRSEKAAAEDESGGEAAGYPVTVCMVNTRTFDETIRGIGTLKASQTVELRPEVTGILEKVSFEEGARIPEGAILFKIDDRKLRRQEASMKAQIDAAQARLENARRNYRRLQTLFERGSVSEDERDQAEMSFETSQAEVQQLQAELALINEKLDDTSIKAPLAGIMSDAFVDPGDYVNIGEHLATIYSTDSIEVSFFIPEIHTGRVKSRQAVAVVLDAYPDKTFRGNVSYVSPSITPRTRDLQIKALIDNPDNLLYPGAFARTTVIVNRRKERPFVPEDALVPVRDGYIVYVVQGDEVTQKKVDIGLRDGVMVEITSGLKGGETVVKSGQMKISDGSKVVINERVDCHPDSPSSQEAADKSSEEEG